MKWEKHLDCEDDFSDEFLTAIESRAEALRGRDADDCFLCIAESVGEDD